MYDNMKIGLVSLTPSHYRKLIYLLMQEQMQCEFVFGRGYTSVKSIDLSIFNKAVEVPKLPLGLGGWYKMPGALKEMKKYDVVINDMGIMCLTSWLFLLKAKFRNQKVYHWDHGWYGREGFVKKWMKRLYFGLADGTFVYGNYARNLMIKNGFNGGKLHVIHNSLDYDFQLKIREKVERTGIFEKHFGNSSPVLCFIGRLTPVKKLDQIIDALLILKNRGLECNLVLIGEGPEYNRLLDKVERLDLHKNIWFYGACYEEMVNAELIYNADLCVAPGNIGLTAMHAMMFGCPCISHNDFPWQMPEFEAIKQGITGDFFWHNDITSLANCISRWFDQHAGKREEVRAECYKEIDENWNPHKQIEIIKKVIYG